MKKFFTLIATALVAIGANAQTTWNIDAEAEYVVGGVVAANSTLVSDDNVTIKTVFDGATVGSNKQTIGGLDFTAYIQVRVDKDPSADNLTGEQRAESTPLVVTAAQDVSFSFYYRRQEGSNGYESNDGKDIKMIDQTDPSTVLDATMTLDDTSSNYAFGSKTYNLTAGHTYTIYARGTTARIFGFTITPSGATAIKNVKAAADINAPEYNLAGSKVNASYKGIVIKNGKKVVK